MARIASPRGALSELLIEALQGEPAELPRMSIAPAGGHLPTRISSCPCISVTSFTTRGCRASMTAGNGSPLFFDEHVVADSVHENVAAVNLAGGLVRQDPTICASLLWGARALSHLEARWSSHLLGCWREGRSSLLGELTGAAAPEHERALRAG